MVPSRAGPWGGVQVVELFGEAVSYPAAIFRHIVGAREWEMIWACGYLQYVLPSGACAAAHPIITVQIESEGLESSLIM